MVIGQVRKVRMKYVYIVYVDGKVHETWSSADGAVNACTGSRLTGNYARFLRLGWETKIDIDDRTYIQRREVRR